MAVSPDAELMAAMAHVVGTGAATLDHVEREPLEYDVFLAHRAVTRLRGTVSVRGERRQFSMIEKRTEGPALAVPYLTANARREFDAYTSGLLDDLAPGIRAPRLHGSRVDADGGITLWLEDVPHVGGRPLDARAILSSAQALGALAGRFLGRVPDAPWLFDGWIDRNAQPEAVVAGLTTLHGRAASSVPEIAGRLEEVERLILAQPRVRHILESLPHTLCHHDAVGANLFATDGGIVLIDWESVGPGPIGADLASLLFASVRRGDADADVVVRIFDDAVHQYAAGLRREAKFQSGEAKLSIELVRRGVDAAIALRWKLAVDLLAGLATGEPARRGSRPREHPLQSRAELLLLVDVLLSSAGRVLS